MHPILAGLALLAVGAPSQILMLDVLGKTKAPGSIKWLAPPALVLLIGVVVFSVLNQLSLINLIGVGLVAGIIGTAALDSIRIPGYLLGLMPLDLPLRFGTKALNLDNKFMLAMMPKVMDYVNKEVARGVSTRTLMDEKGFPRLPVRVIRDFARPTLGEVLRENNVPLWKVRLTGYLWHYLNGASFGIAHTILFGKGAWIYTIGFGLLLAIVFLTILKFLVPPMRPGFKLPAVVLLAHAAVVVVLGLITQIFVTSADEAYSFLQILYSGIHL